MTLDLIFLDSGVGSIVIFWTTQSICCCKKELEKKGYGLTKKVWLHGLVASLPDADAGSANRAAATCALNEHTPGARTRLGFWSQLEERGGPTGVSLGSYAAWRGVIARGVFFACAS
jgi:hypothetical protein